MIINQVNIKPAVKNLQYRAFLETILFQHKDYEKWMYSKLYSNCFLG